ncbi:hypothetical protein DEU40_103191 [Chryseobacterium sp. AG844]|nr:hypothetical protein DEU40_103191 [Chryseobacterium sp. AG844]
MAEYSFLLQYNSLGIQLQFIIKNQIDTNNIHKYTKTDTKSTRIKMLHFKPFRISIKKGDLIFSGLLFKDCIYMALLLRLVSATFVSSSSHFFSSSNVLKKFLRHSSSFNTFANAASVP